MRRVQPMVDSDTAVAPLLLNEHQTSEYLGVSLSYLRKSRSEGSPGNRTPAPPFVHVGGRVYYRINDLKNWVNNLEAKRVVGR